MKALKKNSQIHNPERGLKYTLEKIKLNTFDCKNFKKEAKDVENKGVVKKVIG